jgi:hypothetical protein
MQPENGSPEPFRHDGELAAAIKDVIGEMMMRLSPAAQARLLAFMHLLEEPETTIAELDVEPTGVMRLALTHTGARPGARSN